MVVGPRVTVGDYGRCNRIIVDGLSWFVDPRLTRGGMRRKMKEEAMFGLEMSWNLDTTELAEWR